MTHQKSSKYRYLFGPVLSRRLGISLGVDLVPHKTCSLNCVYCECGKTTHLTLKREAYIPTGEIKKELNRFLSENPELDFITFSGAGEPTLHKNIQEIIRYLKQNHPCYPVALLTNSTLLERSDVKEQILEIDLVIASLDSATETGFNQINRPHSRIDLNRVIEGLAEFRKEFANQFWVEVFIVPGINDDHAELSFLKEAIETIGADQVHLNSLDRPGTENWVKAVDQNALKRMGAYLNGAKTVDLDLLSQKSRNRQQDYREPLLATIKRRPCTAEDIARMFGISLSETVTYLDAVVEMGDIEKKEMQRGVFYQVGSHLKQVS
jgi:wyosine [tRNA(Phe)-imidazoG37] synthetase (radical SAM superfamily)